MKKSILIVVSILVTFTLLVGCGPAATPAPTATPVPTAVPPVVPTANPVPTAVPTATTAPTPVPTVAPTLVTVIGKMKASPFSLSEDVINAHLTEAKYHDPWVGDTGSDVMEKGILLKDLLPLLKTKTSAKTIGLIGSDGNEYDVSIADAQAYNIMLVHWVDGTVLDASTGGPVKVAYPADATAYTNDSWAWWVTVIIIK